MQKYLIAISLVASMFVATEAQARHRGGRAKGVLKAVASAALRPVKRVHGRLHAGHGHRSGRAGACAACK